MEQNSKTLTPELRAWWREQVQRQAERAGVQAEVILAGIDVDLEYELWLEARSNNRRPALKSWLSHKIRFFVEDRQRAVQRKGSFEQRETAGERRSRLVAEFAEFYADLGGEPSAGSIFGGAPSGQPTFAGGFG